MHNPEQAIFTNMCMIYDHKGNVLVQNRVKSWCGVAFPGGHIENMESIVDSVKREILEETGLIINNLSLCGIKQWFSDDIRNVCFLYKTCDYSGELISSPEGDNFWIPLEKITSYKLSSGFFNMLDIFLKDDLSEYYHLRKNNEVIDTLK